MEGLQGFFASTYQKWFGESQQRHQQSSPTSVQQADTPRPIEPIPLIEFLAEAPAGFSVNSIEEVQGTQMERLYHELSTRGFVVFSIGADSQTLLPTLIQLRSESQRFFALDTSEKERRLARFAGENRGYVLIPEV